MGVCWIRGLDDPSLKGGLKRRQLIDIEAERHYSSLELNSMTSQATRMYLNFQRRGERHQTVVG